MLNRKEIKIIFEIIAGIFFALVVYVASQVIGEPYSIFDYGRF